jgi:hypothetical protein
MSMSVAEKRYQRRHALSMPSLTDTVPPESGTTDTDTVHARLEYVLDQIMGLIPDEVSGHPMAKMLVAFTREGKKDIKRMPADFIIQLSKPIGEAFTWVAEGSMNDIEIQPDEDGLEKEENSDEIEYADSGYGEA